MSVMKLFLCCHLIITLLADQSEANDLYNCPVNFWPLPESSIKISASFLQPSTTRTSDENPLPPKKRTLDDRVELVSPIESEMNFDTLSKIALNFSLPTMFFMNGFNNDGAINGTWMHTIAKLLSGYNRLYPPKFNAIFLIWHIPDMFTENLLEIVPAYYKTMANYETILDKVARVLLLTVDYLRLRQIESKLVSSNRREEARLAPLEFYGHSLGSHIGADAVARVHKARPFAKFSRLLGLDPARPCFFSSLHGISKFRQTEAINMLAVVHSNAGLFGTSSERGQIEIVLNGGTFQPGCPWLDAGCHHARATDILNYVDDQCQMVAYKCNSYEQFKLGACDTVEAATEAGQTLPASVGAPEQYALVNLPQQHIDSQRVRNQLANVHVRQLAQCDADLADDADTHLDPLQRILSDEPLVSKATVQLNEPSPLPRTDTTSTGRHYVSTNPNAAISGSHCLQHYQVRLILLMDDRLQQRRGCSLADHLVADERGAPGILVELFHEPASLEQRPLVHRRRRMTRSLSNLARQRLTPIVGDLLHTALVTFEREPELFVGALLSGIDLGAWSKCISAGLLNVSSSTGFDFVLDVAFMSHVSKNVRNAFSSVLCGRWNLDQAHQEQVELNLCTHLELATVSQRIDKSLGTIRFEHTFDTWLVSLLDSLFHLFIQWDPFYI